MSEVTAALAALQLNAARATHHNMSHSSTARPFALTSPTTSGQQKAFSSRALCLFLDPQTAVSQAAHSHFSHAVRTSDWSALIGDVFQAVIGFLPAHTAQHAMLVCHQWHNSVTHGLLQLRPRILNMHSIVDR